MYNVNWMDEKKKRGRVLDVSNYSRVGKPTSEIVFFVEQKRRKVADFIGEQLSRRPVQPSDYLCKCSFSRPELPNVVSTLFFHQRVARYLFFFAPLSHVDYFFFFSFSFFFSSSFRGFRKVIFHTQDCSHRQRAYFEKKQVARKIRKKKKTAYRDEKLGKTFFEFVHLKRARR